MSARPFMPPPEDERLTVEADELRRERRKHTNASSAAAWVAGLLLALGLLLLGCARESPAQREIEKSIAAVKAGDDNLAIACLEAALKIDPGNSEALSRRAGFHLSRGESEEAIRLASEAIRIDPNCWRALFVRGIAFPVLEGPEPRNRGIAFLQRVVEIKPDFAAGWSNLGVFHMCNNENVKARSEFDKALALDPGTKPYIEDQIKHVYRLRYWHDDHSPPPPKVENWPGPNWRSQAPAVPSLNYLKELDERLDHVMEK